MERTGKNEHFKAEVIEQWIFDFYLKKCVDCLKNKTWLHMEESKNMLQALLVKSIDPDFPGNKAKSHLLILVFSVKQLVQLGVEEECEENRRAESLEDNTNIFEVLDGLQSSLAYLYRKTDEPETKEKSRECLFYTYVFLVENVCLSLASEENNTEITEALETCLAKGLRKIKSVVDKENKSEMRIREVCEKLVKKPSLSQQLPLGSELIERVTDLVLDIHGVFDPPVLLELAASHIMENPGVLERFLQREKEELFFDTRVNTLADIDTFLEERGINTQDEDEMSNRMEAVRDKAKRIRLKRQMTGGSSASIKNLIALVDKNSGNTVSSSTSQDSDSRSSSLEPSGRATSIKNSRNYRALSPPVKKKVKKSSKAPEEEMDSISVSSGSESGTNVRGLKHPRTFSPTTSSKRKKLKESSQTTGEEVTFNEKLKRMRDIRIEMKGRQSLLEYGKSKKPRSHSSVHLGRWTPDEENRFILKTLELGEGCWSEIKEAIKTPRSSVQLKDKWRTLPESQILSVAREHGLPYKRRKNRKRQ